MTYYDTLHANHPKTVETERLHALAVLKAAENLVAEYNVLQSKSRALYQMDGRTYEAKAAAEEINRARQNAVALEGHIRKLVGGAK